MKKYALGFFAVAVVMFGGVVFTQLQVALGWTNPTCTPPGCDGAIKAVAGNVGINVAVPSTTLTIGGEVSVDNNRIRNVATPIDGADAVNKDFVLAQAAGGGSLVFYYKTDSANPGVPPPPTCPSGYNPIYAGFGPHYLGLFAYDWLQNGTGGTGGGFAPGFTPPVPNGTNGATYVLRSVGFASDSVCSQQQTSQVPVASLYNNTLSYNYTGMVADACYTDATTGQTICNRCLVCQK